MDEEIKKSKYLEEQITFRLKLAEPGTLISEVYHQLGIAKQTFTVGRASMAIISAVPITTGSDSGWRPVCDGRKASQSVINEWNGSSIPDYDSENVMATRDTVNHDMLGE